eukprot:m.110055 g.110055  ORF g.110055 m.110055 type:complete len:60 (+) comp16015_c2_seq2:1772-1951(+)
MPSHTETRPEHGNKPCTACKELASTCLHLRVKLHSGSPSKSTVGLQGLALGQGTRDFLT